MIRCYICGTDNLDGTEYCDECGSHLRMPPWFKPPPPSPKPQKSDVIKKSKLLWRKFAPKGRSNFVEQSADPPFPFARKTERYVATVPLAKSFRYGHEPVGSQGALHFVGRQNELDLLAQRILFSNGGSFLVTGYRGVGKTSFINQVVRKLKEAIPWAKAFLEETELTVIDIYLNIARPLQPSELMHHLIRRLYDRLVEEHIYHLLDAELKNALTLAYQRTSVNMARKMAEASERNFGFNEASLGGEFLKATVKASWGIKRSRTQNYEMTFLGYDDKAAEHDIISILQRLTKGYAKPITRWNRTIRLFSRASAEWVRLKIVFIFDELDKLEEFITKVEEKGGGEQKPVIDVILGALKNLFTTSGVTFVFVAGKDLQERWLEDIGKGDSVYESVFSYDKYLPCLWADVDSVCDALVDLSQISSSDKYQAFQEFKKYLAYKGRGIPRRIIRTFNEYVEWISNQPVLAFTKQNIRNIRFFAGLQNVLTVNGDQLFGDSDEEALGTQSDKRRLGVYYLVDWILRQGAAEFTLKDVLSASERLSTKIALAQKIAPGVAADIIKILLEADYLQEVQKPIDRVLIGDANIDEEKRYKLAPRRLVEMGKPAADVEVDTGSGLPVETIFPTKHHYITSIGKYKIIRMIARGGMGTVYQATDEYSGRNVAIKVPYGEADQNLLDRFEREAMIMDELNHPNVVRLYDWGKDNGKLYIAMEYLEGHTLQEIISNQKTLSLSLAIAVAKTVAEAVQYIHQKGFVRNDIKPSNIMLTTEGRVCLFDFGITKPMKPKSELQSKFDTEASAIVGTPLFMAPEQFRGSVDERSDIYSLGVVLYEMLTGVFPFYEPQAELISTHLHQTPEPPSQRVSLPGAIDEVILKCLEKDPDDRFQTMAELAVALTSVVDLPYINLKSVVSKIREEVEEMEEVNRIQTLAPPTSFAPLPQMASLDKVDIDDDNRIPLSLLQPGVDLLPEATIPRIPILLETNNLAPPDTRPYLRLRRGNMEDVDFHSITSAGDYSLEKKTSVGRSSENDITLNDAKVSRYHAELTVDGKGWFIEDFNSSLGTFVNGEKIATRWLLRDKDEIQIGDFVFVFNQAAPTK